MNYVHRVPFHRVDNISVTGAVGLTHISFQVRLSKRHLSQGLGAGASLLCLGPLGGANGSSQSLTQVTLGIGHTSRYLCPVSLSLSRAPASASLTPSLLVCPSLLPPLLEAMWFPKEPSWGIKLNLAQIPALPLSSAVGSHIVTLLLPASVSSSVQGAQSPPPQEVCLGSMRGYVSGHEMAPITHTGVYWTLSVFPTF